MATWEVNLSQREKHFHRKQRRTVQVTPAIRFPTAFATLSPPHPRRGESRWDHERHAPVKTKLGRQETLVLAYAQMRKLRALRMTHAG